LAWCLYAALALGLDLARGAHTSDLCAFEDEPAHAVTGLMARDWIVAGFPAPMEYAEDYYLHYPKVAIGQWPPVFYTIQAAWTLVLGDSTFSLVGLMAAITGGVAALVFGLLRRELGAGGAAVAGLLLLLLPAVQAYGAMVMTEAPLTLLCTAAAIACGRFFDAGRVQDAILFGGLAGLAVLTKGSALGLAGVPLIALLLTGRWDRARRPAFWGSAVIVVLLAAPWYVRTLGFTQSTWVGGASPNLGFSAAALTFYGRELAHLGGWGLLLSGVLGAIVLLGGSGPRGRWAALIAWPPSLLLLHAVVPSSLDERHLVLLAPTLCAVACAGLARLARNLGWTRGAGTWLPLVLLGVFLLERFELPRKHWLGVGAAARSIVAEPRFAESVLLICSDVAGEGAFVVAVAQADRPRPGHYVLRASKTLSTSDWVGRDYRLRFATSEQVADWLEEVPVGLVAFDGAAREDQRLAHHDQLQRALSLRPERWVEHSRHDLVKGGRVHPDALVIYRQVGCQDRPLGEADRSWVLGRDRPRF